MAWGAGLAVHRGSARLRRIPLELKKQYAFRGAECNDPRRGAEGVVMRTIS